MLFLIKRNKKGEQKEKVCLDNKKPLERGALVNMPEIPDSSTS